MVLSNRSNNNLDETMPQTVPSAGFTPPFDYSNFADSFDLSLLPGGDNLTAVSPSSTFYSYAAPSMSSDIKLKATYFPNSPQSVDENDINLGPDFQKLLSSDSNDQNSQIFNSSSSSIYLEVPQNTNCYPNSPSGSAPYSPQSLLSPNDHFGTYPSPNSDYHSLYPNSPSDISLYPHSPNSYYSHTSNDGYNQFVKKEFYPNSPTPNSYSSYIKEENYLSPCGSVPSPTSPTNYSNLSSPSPRISITGTNNDVLDLIGSAIIKQETTIDFDNILNSFHVNDSIRGILENSYKSSPSQVEKSKNQDHQLLREALRDTSFQKKFNIKPFELDIIDNQIKMESSDDACGEQLPSDKIDPVLNLAIEQMKKDVTNTCTALGISTDPSQWSSANVLSWLQWTTNQFGLPAPVSDQWDISGSNLVTLTEEDFTRRAPQSGSILYAQLEIWKAAFNEDEFKSSQWMPESTSSNASSGDMSDDDEDESMPEADASKPTTSRGGGSSHIHLWQFLKELLASPQTHGSCIRWIDRTKGIFKIEDSVKVARLWGKRKNRPAMNYDKLSRSIRQYYKKGIMKKTERSQRLVYQFCHPYNL